MKKIGKLNINPEKVMRNDELIILKGGYVGWTCIVERDDEYYTTDTGMPGDTCEEAGQWRKAWYDVYYPSYNWKVNCC